MSEFNSCAHLVKSEDLEAARQLYDDLLLSNQDPYAYILNLQNGLQEKLSSSLGRLKAPKDLKTKGEVYDFVLQQKIALDDEWREMVEAMAGMSLPEKDRSALWKKWKGKYEDLRAENIDSLSHEDRLELMFEVIDAAHFFNNVLLALGVDAETYFTLYYIKNAENIARQKRGY